MDKIIFLRKDNELSNLNNLLSVGWKVVQMSVTAENESPGCYVWIKKDEDDNVNDKDNE